MHKGIRSQYFSNKYYVMSKFEIYSSIIKVYINENNSENKIFIIKWKKEISTIN
jgi:hypothetical protein